MITVSQVPVALSGQLNVFHTTDPLLYNSPVLVFYDEAASIGAASSRIQVHVYTPAGFESYLRLSISPSSPYYAAVNALPREEQGDEVCRGIAYALSKYFSELSQRVKQCWTSQISANKRPNSPFGLFSATHVAVLASRLVRVENSEDVLGTITKALGEQRIPWLDVDVILPIDTIKSITEDDLELLSEEDITRKRYGRYAPIIAAFGERSFLPTSKMKRAASKPSNIGRSHVFQLAQKEIVRKEMCELVDTEASYVEKLAELSGQIRGSLALTVEQTLNDDKDRTAVDALFPPSLDSILEIHQALLASIQRILNDTEDSAIQAMDCDSSQVSSADKSDCLGVAKFAEALLAHLPESKEAYSHYTSAHSKSTSIIRSLTKTTNGELMHALREIGEQRLTSLLIEPIQRLPRYSLYIDTISKQLPIGHPALVVLLRLRDLVTDICLTDDEELKVSEVDARLRSLISEWPPANHSHGRLVTVLDVMELDAPFISSDAPGRPGLLLLFTDRIVFVNKNSSSSMSARTLQASAQKSRNQALNSDTKQKLLTHVATFDLADCLVTEAQNGQVITIYDPTVAEDVVESAPPFVLQLDGVYAGKSSRLMEEVVKAKLEGRFEESERERPTWEVRSGVGESNGVNLFTAVFEHGHTVKYNGHLRLEIDLKESTGAISPRAGTHAKIRITPGGNTFCHLAVDSAYGSIPREKIALEDLQMSIGRKVNPIFQAQLSLKDSAFIPSLIAQHREILESLDLVTAEPPGEIPIPKSPVKMNRPISPVKTLSNFLASKAASGNGQSYRRADAVFTAMPNLQPRTSSLPKPVGRNGSRPTSKDEGSEETHLQDSSMHPSTPATRVPATKSLEDTFSTYVLAIQARKGNVVGKIINARAEADKAQVNQLYNTLVEDSNLMVLAAQAPVDVLFAAFEKFMHVAWKDKYGQVIETKMLQDIQMEAECRSPVEFEQYFASCKEKMSAPNQRALKGLVKLLAELLDGTNNDGDRGIMTAAFASLIITDDDSLSYIAIVDNFVDHIDGLFGENVHVRGTELGSAASGHSRNNSKDTGSIGSKDSSMRRKFGFTGSVHRENSKSEHESKVGAVWRSLSKSKQTPEPMPIRANIQRHNSATSDVQSRIQRPASSDQSVTLGQFAFERPKSQDSTWMSSTPLSTIGENVMTPVSTAARKKRRSSLSDLGVNPSPRPSSVRPSPAGSRLATITNSQKDVSSLSKIATPQRTTPRARLPSNFRKENSPMSQLDGATSPSQTRKSEAVVIKSYSPGKTNTSVLQATPTKTGITAPSPRIGLSERSSANAMKFKPDSLGKPITSPIMSPLASRKLRLQSPQKLRERLNSEQKELQNASSTLQNEMNKIGDEISALSPTRTSMARQNSIRGSNGTTASAMSPSIADLSKRLTNLGATVTSGLAQLAASNKALQEETLSALTQSETRTKKLDELYREANAENEALYKRFNDELGRVVKTIRGGDGVDELRRRVKEQEAEMERLRRERARLKREVVGLRARLGD